MNTSLSTEPPSCIHAIVLAAGSSRRMGTNKLLLPWPPYDTILMATISALLPLFPSSLQQIHIVTGHQAEQLQPLLHDLPIHILHNPHHNDGMLSSLQTALRHLPPQATTAMILPADLPMLQTTTLRELLHALPPETIFAPTYQGQRGHPVFLPRDLFQPMLALPAQASPRDLFLRYPERLHTYPVETSAILADIDTPQAYQRALSTRTN